MGKMIMGLLVIIGIELALYMFAGSGDTTNSLFQFLLDPTNSGFSQFTETGIGTNSFLNGMEGIFLAFAAIAGIVAGTGFVFKQDTVIFAAFSAFVGAFTLSIIKFWVFIYSNLGQLGVSAPLISTIFCSPLFVTWFIVILDFVRGRD